MPKDTMTDLRNHLFEVRNHLFEVMEALKDKEEPMDIARAKAVAEVAQVLINSAKVEVEFLNAIDSSETTEFFADKHPEARRRLDAPNIPLRGTVR